MAWVARSGDLVPQSWEGFFEPLFPLPPVYSLSESRIAGGANGGERQKEGKGRKRRGCGGVWGEKEGGGPGANCFRLEEEEATFFSKAVFSPKQRGREK